VGRREGSDLLDAVQADSRTQYVRFWSYKMIYDTTIPVEVALREKTLLAYEFDGEYLDEDYGGPVRGFCLICGVISLRRVLLRLN
jgi:DMSO/TMAO reductase YedYZ molybdopterin-dependent catalytic subunit